MLECNVMLTLFAHYICLHGYMHFINLFNPNKKNIYKYHKSGQKYMPYFEEMCIWSYFGLRREAKSFFFLTEFMLFKFEYNSNFD